MQDKRTESAYWALRLVFGIVPILAGLDKFTNLLVDWQQYLAPLAVRLLPVDPGTFMAAVGVVEVAVGIGVIAGYARFFAWVAGGWLVAITINLLLGAEHLDVAARDVALAVAAFALARIAPLHEAASERTVARNEPAHAHR
jgi:uncharacterized membrane protein YphA (DoxX/SURF4 family)